MSFLNNDCEPIPLGEVLYDVTASKALAAASLCLLRGEAWDRDSCGITSCKLNCRHML